MLKNRIVITAVIIALLASFFLWGVEFIEDIYKNSANPQRDTLTMEIDAVNLSITQIPESEEGLDIKLAELEEELTQEKQIIPDSMDGTSIVDTILKLAESCDVTVTPMNTNNWSSEGTHYMLYTINIILEGKYHNVEDFIDRLENSLYDNLAILDLAISGGQSSDIEDPEPIIANVRLGVYTRN